MPVVVKMHVYLAFGLIGAALLVAAHVDGAEGKIASLVLCGGGLYVLYTEYAELLRKFHQVKGRLKSRRPVVPMDSVL